MRTERTTKGSVSKTGIVAGALAGTLSPAVGAGFCLRGRDVRGGGAITGKVKLAGSPRSPKIVQVGQDREVYGKTHQIFEVEGKNGGLKNAAVRWGRPARPLLFLRLCSACAHCAVGGVLEKLPRHMRPPDQRLRQRQVILIELSEEAGLTVR